MIRFKRWAHAVPVLAICLLGFAPLPSAAATVYSNFYAFGDSLSDAGNDYNLTVGDLPRSPPYFFGHFSNGLTWADDVSKSLNFGAFAPSRKGGFNYAYGGATASRNVPGSHPEIPTIGTQVNTYLKSGSADPKALYSVWIGANDVIDALIDISKLKNPLSVDDAKAELTGSVAAEISALQLLVGAGANHILVGLLPDIGLIPRFNMTQEALGRELSIYYNTLLRTEADLLIPSSDLTYFDAFKLIDDAVADPSAFGLTNVSSACYTGGFTGGGTTCKDPDDYLFWDELHPTRIGHLAVANLALDALGIGSIAPVPLPSGLPLYGVALTTLGLISLVWRRGAVRRARQTYFSGSR